MLLGDDRVLLARTEWLAAARAAIFALCRLALEAGGGDGLGGHHNLRIARGGSRGGFNDVRRPQRSPCAATRTVAAEAVPTSQEIAFRPISRDSRWTRMLLGLTHSDRLVTSERCNARKAAGKRGVSQRSPAMADGKTPTEAAASEREHVSERDRIETRLRVRMGTLRK